MKNILYFLFILWTGSCFAQVHGKNQGIGQLGMSYNILDTVTLNQLFVNLLPNGTTSDSVVVWNSATKQFKKVLQSSISTGVTTVGPFSGSSQTNGASISTTTITFGPADATNPGMVKASGTQTFGPTVTFTNAPIFTTSSTVGQLWTASGTGGQGGWANAPASTNISNADLTMGSGGHTLTIAAGNPLKISGQPGFTPVASTQVQVKATDSSILQMPLTSGTYTPSLTNTTNITSSSVAQAYYSRIGNIVHVMIGGSLTMTALLTASTLTFTLPITSTNTVVPNIGVGNIAPNSGSFLYVPGLVNQASTGTGTFVFFSSGSSGTSSNFVVVFDYSL